MIDRMTADIETTSWGEILCIGFFWKVGEQSKQGYFRSLKSFFDMLENEKVRQVYFHYGGGFDFNYLLKHIRENTNYEVVNFLEVGGLIYTFSITNDDKWVCNFDDSFPLFRCSLDKVSEALLDKHKKNEKIDVKHLEDYDIKLVIEYCIYDCELLYKCLEEFENELQMPLELSTPMQALKFWKTNSFDKHYQLWRDLKPFNLGMINTLRSWYYGGHVDVYRLYGENLFEYDIVSAYGSIMKNYGAIIGYPRQVSKRYDGESKAGLYCIQVLDNLEHPHSCLKHQIRGMQSAKLYFLNTRQELFVTELDLRFMDEFNISYNIKYGILFDYEQHFFSDYVDYWYEKRTKSKKLAFISKLMINALYGKWGQNPVRKNSACIIKNNEKCDFWYDEKLRIGKQDKIVKSWYLQPQISAWITSGARCLLHYYMYKFIQSGAKIYYCDTDSLFIDKDLHNDLNLKNLFTDSKELGKMELESEIYKGYFLGCKFYGVWEKEEKKWNWHVRAKGFHKSFFHWKHFEKALTENFVFESEQKFIRKFKSSLKTVNDYVCFDSMKKVVREFALKRKKKGNRTEAYFLTNNNRLI